MNLRPEYLLIAVLLLSTGVSAVGIKPSRTEMNLARQWANKSFAAPKNGVTSLPVSFIYNGKPSSEFLGSWEFTKIDKKLDSNRTECTQTYTDPTTGLQLRAVITRYNDFPTVEWICYLKNTGSADTPIIEQIRSLNATWRADSFLLHHFKGSPCQPTDYQPFETKLEAGSTKAITAAGGRSTNSDMSYFNLEMPGGGVIIAVGWPGQWASNWVRDAGNGLQVIAGQELTHFKLHPGEEVRTPSTVLQFWSGEDWIRSQNIWRRWMIAHNMPKPGGKLPPSMFVASSSRQFAEMINANEENQKHFIDRYLEEGIWLDYWWMDAGWYINESGWPNVGTWEVDTKRFPNGLRAVSDYAHSKGMKIVTWFEPERVTGGTWIAKKHPEWVLSGSLLNLGNKEAWNWLVNHVDKTMTQQGIDLYRQDFNMDPLANWRNNDAEDRQGITEIGHVTGLLAYWDELQKRHPNALFDECASGGRRNDVECMKRAVPLWRTDAAYNCIGTQNHTYGISFWIPYSGTGTVGQRDASYYGEGKTVVDHYAFFSNAAPSLGTSIDMRVEDNDYPAFKQCVDWFRTYMSPDWYGDYYPLTPFSPEADVWMAWQFDTAEKGTGFVQAFRRDNALDERMELTLRGLDAKATYELKDVLANKTWTAKGSDLMKGLVVTIADKPGTVLIAYKKTK